MAAHRYWQVLFTATNQQNDLNIGEIRLWDGPDATGTNWGLNSNGCVWTADSQQVSHEATKLGDGATVQANAWFSANTALPHWAKADLVTPRDIQSFTLTNPNSSISFFPKDFKLQWSDDGVTWTDAATITNFTWLPNNSSFALTWNVATGAGPLKIGRALVQAVTTGPSKLRVSKVAAEAIYATAPGNLRVTKQAVEVIYLGSPTGGGGPPPDPSAARRRRIIISG